MLIVPTACVFPGKPEDLQMEKGYMLQLVRILQVIFSNAESTRGHPFPKHAQPGSLSKEERADFNHAITSLFDSIFSNYLGFGAYS